MNLSRTTQYWFWPALWLVLACASTALAHGPKDHSARLILMGEEMELGVTLGPDLAEAALKHAGLAPAAVTELLASHGPSGHGTVSATASAALVGLRAGDKDLSPTRAIVMTDGLEYLFVLTFPRPMDGALTVHAKYLDAMEGAPSGSLEVVQDGGGRIALELLSRSQTTRELTLPRQVITPTPSVAPTAPVVESSTAPLALAPPAVILPATTTPKSQSAGWWCGCIAGGFLGALLVVRFLRRAKGKSVD